MSVKQMARVWEWSTAEGSGLLVLLALADHADDDGYCYPGVARIARKARLSERSTQRIIGDLEAAGEVSRDIGQGLEYSGQRGPGRTNRYRIHIRGCQDVTPNKGGDTEPQKGVTNSALGGDTAMAPKPSGESSENHQARKARVRKSSGKPETPEAVWCAQLFGRKLETKWTVSEVKALELVREEMTVESRALIQAYYQDERSKSDKGIHRRDLATFLNNYLGELDRASEWAKKNRKKAGAAAASMNGTQPKLSSDVVQTTDFQEWLAITYDKSIAQIPDHLRLDLVTEFNNQ